MISLTAELPDWPETEPDAETPARAWGDIVERSSNLVKNFDRSMVFWKTTTVSRSMHVMATVRNHDHLGKSWNEASIDSVINIAGEYVNDQLELTSDDKDKEWLLRADGCRHFTFHIQRKRRYPPRSGLISTTSLRYQGSGRVSGLFSELLRCQESGWHLRLFIPAIECLLAGKEHRGQICQRQLSVICNQLDGDWFVTPPRTKKTRFGASPMEREVS